MAAPSSRLQRFNTRPHSRRNCDHSTYRARRLVSPSSAPRSAPPRSRSPRCAGGGEAAAPTDFAYLSFAENTQHPGHPHQRSATTPARLRTRRSRSTITHPAAGELRPAAPAARRPGRAPGRSSPAATRPRSRRTCRPGDKLVDVDAAARRARRRRRHPPRRSLDDRGALRRRGLRAADRVQRRGHLVQQADLRRQRHRGARRPGTSSSTPRRRSTPPACSRSRPTARTAGRSPASSATTSSATLGPDALQKVADGDAKLTDPEYVEAADGGRRARRGRLLRPVGRIDRLHDRRQPVPHRRGRHVLHGQLDPRRTSTTRRRTRSAPRTSASCRSPTSRAARAAATSSPRTSACRSRCRKATLQRRHRRVARAASPRTSASPSLGDPGRHHRLRDEHARRGPAAAHADRAGEDQRHRRRACCGSRRCSTPRPPRRARRTRRSSSPARSRPEEFMELVQADLK